MNEIEPIGTTLPDATWLASDLFDWLDASVPLVLVAERRTAEMRQAVGYALWLLRGTLADGAYGKQVQALATTHDVSDRTLRSWRAEAEQARGLAAHEATTEHHRKQLPVPRPAETVAELETPDQWVRQANHFRSATAAVLRHSIPRPVLLGMRQRIDEALGTDTTAAEAKPRKPVKASGSCPPHAWTQRKGGPLGLTYLCERCDTRSFNRPKELVS